jgi:hypothetical protein
MQFVKVPGKYRSDIARLYDFDFHVLSLIAPALELMSFRVQQRAFSSCVKTTVFDSWNFPYT